MARPSYATRLRHPQVLVAVGIIALAAYGLRHSVSATTGLILVVIVPSIILHEVSHGAAALAFGDDTARRAGRLTLNPLRHVDPVGTLLLPGLLALSGLGVFGYARPVPVNPSRMRRPRNQAMLTSLAGPATNLVLAGMAALALRATVGAATMAAEGTDVVASGLLGLGDRLLFLAGIVNVSLAVFNLIPLPPLDGSSVVERFLPASAWPAWRTVQRFAMPALLILVLLDGGRILSHVFGPAQRAWLHLLTL